MKCKILVFFVILYIIIKNVNENKILKCYIDCMYIIGIFVLCLVFKIFMYIERLLFYVELCSLKSIYLV